MSNSGTFELATYTAIKNSGKILKKFEVLDATEFFKESAGICRNQESLN
jgi:hypothetical protein